MQKRLTFLAIVFLISCVALTARLAYFQIIKAQELSARGRFQHNIGRVISTNRGSILASDGSYLSASSDAWLVFASMGEFNTDPGEAALKLTQVFVTDPADKTAQVDEINRIKGLLTQKDLVWIPLKSKISSEMKKQIEELELPGIGFEKEEARVYPEGATAAQLLGFVGKDEDGADRGYFGLEGYYDFMLTGKKGFVERESDAFGDPILFGEAKQINPSGGVDLVTFIDKRIQLLLDQKLQEGIEKYGAKSGSGIIMDPKTGGVLAMSSFPSFDPKTYQDFSNELFKNTLISDSFEPGSIFKPVVMAAALDANLISPDTVCDACRGPVAVDKYLIQTWNDQYFPGSTMTEVIVHSDNVGMVYVGKKLGIDKLYDYISNFGFGNSTEIDLQGEAVPQIKEKELWNVVDQATISFGQGIAVTPIQMIRAIATIANRGIEVTPRVVKQLTKDSWSQPVQIATGKQIVSPQAAADITQMMEQAVVAGEAKWAAPKGYEIAGKTGTAQIPVAGHYDPEKTNASFVGFAPASDPRFVMLITLKEPETSPWASETAAPLWFSIAKELFAYMGVQPN